MADRRLAPARARGSDFPTQAGSSHAAPARSPDQAEVTVGAQLRELRKAAGLSQRALAERVGTTASVICRLEDEAYGGHTLDMLRRIGSVLGKRVEVRFLPEGAENQAQIPSVLPLPPAASADPEGN
jgi:DNA-binding XRE family transcriptional regulator